MKNNTGMKQLQEKKERLLTKILIVLAAVGLVMAVINLAFDENAKDAAAVLGETELCWNINSPFP